MAFNIPKGFQQLHGKKSAKPEAGWCKSLPRAAVPLEDGEWSPFPLTSICPQGICTGALSWGKGWLLPTNSKTKNPLTLCLCIFFLGFLSFLVPVLYIAKTPEPVWRISKACLCPESQWRDGDAILSVSIPCYMWGTISPQPHLMLMTSKIHSHPDTSLVPPSMQRLKTGSCSRRRLASI